MDDINVVGIIYLNLKKNHLIKALLAEVKAQGIVGKLQLRPRIMN